MPSLELGRHPVSSHFPVSAVMEEIRYDVSLGICQDCGVVQLLAPVPHEALVSPYDWFTYREPERHLDDLAGKVAALPGIARDARIVGISSKDQSTLDRFETLGFPKPWCLDPATDLGIGTANAGIESVQKYLTARRAAQLAGARGAADIVIARHIAEHAEDVSGFLTAAAVLLREGGYLVLEVPDCLANMARQDITMVWEEHSVYFTPDTFRAILPRINFEEALFENYPLTYENCLVLVGRKQGGEPKPMLSPMVDEASREAFAAYAGSFADWRRRHRAYMEAYLRQGNHIALYGAGHLSCAFVNYYGLADLIAFVADDTLEKQGLFLPGSKIPIVPSERLVEEGIGLALLCLAPESEEKVIANNAAFTAAGGRFKSIFAASGRSLRAELGTF